MLTILTTAVRAMIRFADYKEGSRIRGGYKGWRVANRCEQTAASQPPSFLATRQVELIGEIHSLLWFRSRVRHNLRLFHCARTIPVGIEVL
jgi:hypothetical protein